jgi:hypothetical protein
MSTLEIDVRDLRVKSVALTLAGSGLGPERGRDAGRQSRAVIEPHETRRRVAAVASLCYPSVGGHESKDYG